MNDNHPEKEAPAEAASPLRQQILAAQDLKRETVYVEEWDLTVYVTELTAAAKTEYQALGVKRDEEGAIMFAADGITPVVNRDAIVDFQEALLIRTLVDDTGNRIFSNDDLAVLKKKSASVLERLHEVSARLNKTRPKDVEEQAKN